MWQDAVFAAGSLVFIAALLRMVAAREKPPLSSSVSTGVVLGLFAFCYFTLHLTFAGVTGAVSSGLWLVLAAQKHRETV